MGCIIGLVLILLLGLGVALMTFNPPVIGNETVYCVLPFILLAVLALALRYQRR